MTRSVHSLSVVILCWFALPFQGLAQAGNGIIKLTFRLQFHGGLLEPGKSYATASGDSVQLDRVRFYVGNIRFNAHTTADGKTDSAYYLIDSQDSSSLTIALHHNGIYSNMAFQIGVDSATQVAGLGSGALDPFKGMYWTWNSGYVAVKIEGRSPASRAASHEVEYHLGGYRAPNPAIADVELKIPTALKASTEDSVNMVVPVELDRFFTADFSIAKTAALMTPGPMARQLVLRFKTCFLPPAEEKTGL